jgi:hypothetical protein
MWFENYPFKRIPFPGYPVPFWIRHAGLIEQLVKELKLTPVPEKHMFRGLADVKPTADAPKIIFDPGQWGGNRGPHLHLGNILYLLNEEQWKVFSKRITTEFKSKLELAHTIPVQEMMTIDESLSGF